MNFRIILPAFILIFASAVQAGRESGGGNTAAAEFYQLGHRTLVALTQANPIVILERTTINLNDLLKALETSKIEFVNENLSLNGVSVQAINYPDQKKILVSQNAWNGLSPSQKRQLIIHEVLGLLNIEDIHYKVSQTICSTFSGTLELNHENVLSLNLKKTVIKPEDFHRPDGPWQFLSDVCPGLSVSSLFSPEFFYEAAVATVDGVITYRYCGTDSVNNPRFDSYVSENVEHRKPSPA